MEKKKGKYSSKFYEDLVREVREDFEQRQSARRPYELSWQLNMNFVMGNQYCSVTPQGTIEQEDKFYQWQEKQVYNHVLPIVETRLARLARVRPKMTVRPFTSDEADIATAKLATKILDSCRDRFAFDKLIGEATNWSEVCGSVFYKVTWAENAGTFASFGDKNIYSGGVCVSVCPPFEIYPDSAVCTDISDCGSIIHARAYSVEQIKKIWGETVVGEDVRVFSLGGGGSVGGLGYNSVVPSVMSEVKKGHAVVIERYTRPSESCPEGELVIIAGDKILHHSALPYNCGEANTPDFPFIRQVSHRQAGLFWGGSVVERVIPVQRSYNAVKNRKHEFLNRLAMGVLTVEDGSVDMENLEEEGLTPGKVLTYRQGAARPSMMDAGHVPVDFTLEEERLLNEFVIISGVSEIARTSRAPSAVSSGVALQLLIEQDDTRLAATADEVRSALKRVGKHILRLYKQFAVVPQLMKVVGDEGDIEMFYFTQNDITSDDIVFDTENELSDSPASRRSMVLELLRAGLLQDKNGTVGEGTKLKILQLMGFGNWESGRHVAGLHLRRAQRENTLTKGKLAAPLSVDDHDIHIEEHTAFVVSGEAERAGGGKEAALLEHTELHKRMKLAGLIIQQSEVQNDGKLM